VWTNKQHAFTAANQRPQMHCRRRLNNSKSNLDELRNVVAFKTGRKTSDDGPEQVVGVAQLHEVTSSNLNRISGCYERRFVLFTSRFRGESYLCYV